MGCKRHQFRIRFLFRFHQSATQEPLKALGDSLRRNPEYIVSNRQEAYELVRSGCCGYTEVKSILGRNYAPLHTFTSINELAQHPLICNIVYHNISDQTLYTGLYS